MTTTPEAGTLVPRIEGNPAPTLRADHNALADWAKTKVTIPVATAAARDSAFPAPTQGQLVDRLDLGYVERYYAIYNATTNKQGARVAGWYPAPGSDIFFKTVRVAGLVVAASTDTSLLYSTPFGSPSSNTPLTLTSGVYENEFFKWDATTGVRTLNVKIEGRYDIDVRLSWENTAATIINYLTKNRATISTGTDTDILSMEDILGNTSITSMPSLKSPDTPLLTTDLVRVIARTTVTMQVAFTALPASCLFSIKWAGVNHA